MADQRAIGGQVTGSWGCWAAGLRSCAARSSGFGRDAYRFQLTQDEASDLIVGVAEGSRELPDIAARLQVGGE